MSATTRQAGSTPPRIHSTILETIGAPRSARKSRGSWISGAVWRWAVGRCSLPGLHCAVQRRQTGSVTLLGDVATTYIGIRTLQQQIEIAHENVIKQRKALAIARDLFLDGGTATGLLCSQAENVLAQTEATIPQLTAQLQQGENALRVLLGMTPQSRIPCLAGSDAIPVPPKALSAAGLNIPQRRINNSCRPERADWLCQGRSVSGVRHSSRDTGRTRVGDVFTAPGKYNSPLAQRSAGRS